MKIFSRNGKLYCRDGEKKRSLHLDDTPYNRRLAKQHINSGKFFKSFNIVTNYPLIVDLCRNEIEKKDIKYTTYLTYIRMLENHIEPYFKNKRINEIRPKHIYDWHQHFTDKSSIVTAEAILRPAFEVGIINEWIETSPLIIKKPSLKSDYIMDPFSLVEVNKIINSKYLSRVERNIFGILFFTGMRQSELLALENNNINYNNHCITIKSRVVHGRLDTPKTVSSNRTIDMLSQAEKYFLDQRSITGLGTYLFLNKKGKIYAGSNALQYVWKKVLKKENIKYRNAHQIRHTFASLMLSNGEDLLWVSQMLGHVSPTITLNSYSSFIRTKKDRKTTFLDANGAKTEHYA